MDQPKDPSGQTWRSSLSHGVRPALTHTTGLGGLQAGSGAAAGQTIGGSVRHLIDDNVVLERTITLHGVDMQDVPD